MENYENIELKLQIYFDPKNENYNILSIIEFIYINDSIIQHLLSREMSFYLYFCENESNNYVYKFERIWNLLNMYNTTDNLQHLLFCRNLIILLDSFFVQLHINYFYNFLKQRIQKLINNSNNYFYILTIIEKLIKQFGCLLKNNNQKYQIVLNELLDINNIFEKFNESILIFYKIVTFLQKYFLKNQNNKYLFTTIKKLNLKVLNNLFFEKVIKNDTFIANKQCYFNGSSKSVLLKSINFVLNFQVFYYKLGINYGKNI